MFKDFNLGFRISKKIREVEEIGHHCTILCKQQKESMTVLSFVVKLASLVIYGQTHTLVENY